MSLNPTRITTLVAKAYCASDPDPVRLRSGEIVRIGRRSEEWNGWVWCTGSSGRGCWVPESYLVPHDDGLTGWLIQDYDPVELDIRAGECLSLHHEVEGWWWASNEAGESGWVPATHLGEILFC